jgi:hypothetical protein
MRFRQRGISMSGLLVGLVILVVLALLGMKVSPAYIEYFTAKKAIIAIANENRNGSVMDIRRAFQNRANVDDITAVDMKDLEITKEGGQVVINAAYRKEVPLFANVGLYFNFKLSSQATGE